MQCDDDAVYDTVCSLGATCGGGWQSVPFDLVSVLGPHRPMQSALIIEMPLVVVLHDVYLLVVCVVVERMLLGGHGPGKETQLRPMPPEQHPDRGRNALLVTLQ